MVVKRAHIKEPRQIAGAKKIKRLILSESSALTADGENGQENIIAPWFQVRIKKWVSMQR